MASIKGRNTAPELRVRRLLTRLGYRYRLTAAGLPARPDILFTKRKVGVFVHGCFWHRHDCGRAYSPKTRTDFWAAKFEANVARDQRVDAAFQALGWKVFVVWECELEDEEEVARKLHNLLGPA